MMHKYFLILLLLFPFQAHAQVEATITAGIREPLPIAIAPFYNAGGNPEYAREIPKIITRNLEGSGLFRPVNPQAFIQTAQSLNQTGPNFAEWRAAGAEVLLAGNVQPAKGGKVYFEYRLWDVFAEKEILGQSLNTKPPRWRGIAHIISDNVYTELTGEDSYFDSRIVYVAESGPPRKRIKRLAVMDQDGANHKYLTDGRSLVLTPRFSPTRQQITYMSYESGKPTVYLYDISTGRHQPLGRFPGMTFAPRFSPDGNKVIMSMARDGNTDIYEMRLNDRKPKRITTNSSIDTAPSYAPDGRQIVFESDRGGSQQLYTMDNNGNNIKRITFGQGRYANPVWSPRGDLIAFTRMYKGKFYIGVIRPDGSGERLISTAYHVEGPTWSPNGRVLAYFKERVTGPGGTRRSTNIYTTDITGFNEQVLRTPGNASDPAWSPVLEAN